MFQATRGCGDSYAFVYITDGHATTVDLTKISGGRVKAWWYDPRSGRATPIRTFIGTDSETFTPPSSGRSNDWVLVLDDAARGSGPLGRSSR